MMRNSQIERRSASFRTAINSIYRNRRTTVRRSTDLATNLYSDRHEPRMAYLSLGILLLCITDTYFTLYLMKHGGEEASPVAYYLMQQGDLFFFIVKYIVTAIAVFVVLMHKNFKVFTYFKGYHGLYFMLVSYVTLTVYQLSILTIISTPAIPSLF